MKIALNPAELRSTAGRLRSAANELQGLSGPVAGAGLPEMPPAERAQVEAGLRRAGTALTRGGTLLHGAARELDRRAQLAALAGQGGDLGAFSLSAPLFGALGRLGAVGKKGKGVERWEETYWGPYRGGRKVVHNDSKMWNAKRGSKQDVFSRREGTWQGRSFGTDGYKWRTNELARMRHHPGGERVGGGATFYKKQGSKAAARFGNDRANLALGEVSGEAKFGAYRDKNNVKVGGEASGSVNLVRGSVGISGKHGSAEAGGSVGAHAKAHGGVSFGKDGVSGKAGVGGHVGGEAHAGAGVKAGGVGAKAQAGVTYGLGGQVEGEATVSAKKIKVRARIGATLGLGVNLGVDVEVEPVKVVKNVGKAADDVVDGAGKVLDKFF